MSTSVQASTDRSMVVVASMSAAALMLSVVSLVLTLDDELSERRYEQRLACLELPGPNDCGLDGR